MPVFQKGSINTTALLVPDLYVQIVPPSVTLLNGVPTNILGIVGTASWGPVNSPTTVGNMADYARNFGPIMNRKFDMGTAVAAAVLQGASNMRCVRVTDGTDIAASGTITASSNSDALAIAAAINNGLDGLRGPSQYVVASVSTATVTITAMYTGTIGNTIQVTIAAGSKAATTKVTIALPGLIPEEFDNLGAASATPATATLSGGLDGTTTIASVDLLGVDTVPRKGMYALRNTKASIAMLADADDSTKYTDQVAFGLSEGIYMVLTGPAGQTISAAITAKSTAGIDAYAAKLMLGDWCYFNDTVNGVTRLVSPQGFIAGRLSNLSPEQSSLNKPIYGIVNTQTTFNNRVYSNAELGQLATAGIDVITNPAPGGNYYAARIGHNTSSNPVTNGDNYTRMTNYIAHTLDAGMGLFVGRLQNTDERREAKNTIESFLAGMDQQGMIGDVNGGPSFQVVLDSSNNPMNRVALGYQQADVKVIYLSIVEKFIVNVEGGTSVQITRASTQAA
jgi:hypothetical protein